MALNVGLLSSESAEWYTPGWLVERVTHVLDWIDLDPCSDPDKHVAANHHFTRADDGLSRSWCGSVYMNPPYGRGIGPWIDKLLFEGRESNIDAAIALVPARPDTVWFRPLFMYPIAFLHGRIKFDRASGPCDVSAPFPSALVYLGGRPERFRRTFQDIAEIVLKLGLNS